MKQLTALIWVACILWVAPIKAEERTYHTWKIVNADQTTHEVQLEHAITHAEQSKGLMYRLKLDENHGMAFIYENPRQLAMWMKNTYLPLDIIYVDETGKVISYIENTTPLSLKSLPAKGLAKVAIELNAGDVKKLGITDESRVIYNDLFKNTP